MNPYIINVDNGKIVNPTEIFGKDAKRLMTACKTAFHNSLPSGSYEGCYRSPFRPTLKDICEISKRESLSISKAYKKVMEEWEAANPEEVAKEQISRKAWEEMRDQQFCIIYGIARRHGLYLDWHGKGKADCCLDQWTICKKNEHIARICCM